MAELTTREIARIVAIEFAHWLTRSCIRDLQGYFIIGDTIQDTDTTCFQVDELFDYWLDNVYLARIDARNR